MKRSFFQTTTYAKCIIIGEHAVLRGHPAIVAPIKSKQFKLKYCQNKEALKAIYDNTQYGENLLNIFWSLLQHAMKLLNKKIDKITGTFYLENHVPIACGLGFSAAICVAVTRWLIWKRWVPDFELFNFSKKLEDLFHGKSSGIDIAGVLSENPILYKIYSKIKELKFSWEPQLYLTFSEQTGKTRECVAQVENIWTTNPKFAQSVDQKMSIAVLMAEKALTTNTNNVSNLANALNSARYCFEQWELIDTKLHEHFNILLSHHALAIKPIGSGAGGYVLSLWDGFPPKELPFKTISLFQHNMGNKEI